MHKRYVALAIVPHDAYVLMHDEWYSHVALDYPHATVYPDGRADWIVLDETYPNSTVQDVWKPLIASELKSGIVQQVARFDNVVVYRHK